MQQCAIHLKFQLTNEYSRVGYLLDAIETTDASLQAAMALVCNDDNPKNGKQSNFEAISTCLLPHDPIAKKIQNNPSRRGAGAEISSIDFSKIKSGVGTTGVKLGYHKREEYLKLTTEQKQELHVWRESSANSNNKSKDGKTAKRPAKYDKSDNDKRMKRMISSAIVEEHAKGETTPDPDAPQNAKDGTYLLSLVQALISSTAATIQPPVAATPKPPTVTIQSILKRAATSGPK